MSTEIKDCPFCGSTADVQNNFGVDYWVQCSNLHCGSVDGTIYGSPAPAIEHWNRRPAQAPSAPVARALQKRDPVEFSLALIVEWNEGPQDVDTWGNQAASQLEVLGQLVHESRIAALSVKAAECTWTPTADHWETGAWDSACGETWLFIEGGTPAGHGVKFCQGCGKPVVTPPKTREA